METNTIYRLTNTLRNRKTEAARDTLPLPHTSNRLQPRPTDAHTQWVSERLTTHGLLLVLWWYNWEGLSLGY